MARIGDAYGFSKMTIARHVRHTRADAAAKGPVAPGVSPRVSNVPLVIPEDPCETFHMATGYKPMAHQVDYLRETRDLVFLKGRQIGASEAAASLAIHVARESFGPDVVIVSPTMRQSSEVAQRARNGLWRIGEKLEQDSATVLRLQNGSRILSLAGTPRAVRGYSARLLIVDEAAYVDEATWAAARPMTSATGGRTIVQSTPDIPNGFFYELAANTPEGWARMKVRSEDVSTVSRDHLAREKREMSPSEYAREYAAEFTVAGTLGALWTDEDWEALIQRKEVP